MPAAHYSIKRIVLSGLLKTSKSANVASECSYMNNIGPKNICNITLRTQSCNDGSDCPLLPKEIYEEINDIYNPSSSTLYPGVISNSIAFLAGCTLLTIKERCECDKCLSPLVSFEKEVLCYN